MSFDEPDSYVAAMANLPIKAEVQDSRFIADSDRLAHAFTWRMTAPEKAAIPMCEMLEVEGGKVCSSELFNDSKLFPVPAEQS